MGAVASVFLLAYGSVQFQYSEGYARRSPRAVASVLAVTVTFLSRSVQSGLFLPRIVRLQL